MKSRLQAGHLKYKSVVDGVLTIVRNEGMEGLYKGAGNKLVQSVLTAAILFAGQRRFYELTKQVRVSTSMLSLLCLTSVLASTCRHSRRLASRSDTAARWHIASVGADQSIIVNLSRWSARDPDPDPELTL